MSNAQNVSIRHASLCVLRQLSADRDPFIRVTSHEFHTTLYIIANHCSRRSILAAAIFVFVHISVPCCDGIPILIQHWQLQDPFVVMIFGHRPPKRMAIVVSTGDFRNENCRGCCRPNMAPTQASKIRSKSFGKELNRHSLALIGQLQTHHGEF